MALRVLLVDDHQIVREGFRSLLEREGFTVVGEGADGSDAVRLARSLRPDVAVLDLCMPGMSGLEAACEILGHDPHIKIILLTMHAEEYQVVAALRVGVKGYMLKTQAAIELVGAIRQTVSGSTYLSPAISNVIVTAYLAGAEPPSDGLTSRERHVLQLVAEGKSTKEVATNLEISVKAVESYRVRITEKLGIRGVAGLVRYAIRHGIVELALVTCCMADNNFFDFVDGAISGSLAFLSSLLQ